MVSGKSIEIAAAVQRSATQRCEAACSRAWRGARDERFPPGHCRRNDEALAAGLADIQTRLPGYCVSHVLWLSERSPAFVVQGRSGRAALVDTRYESIWLDSGTGAVIAALDPRDLSLHQRISAANNPLHFGTFAGFGVKLLWFVFGALLSALSLTGVAIYSLRLFMANGGARPGWSVSGQAGWR